MRECAGLCSKVHGVLSDDVQELCSPLDITGLSDREAVLVLHTRNKLLSEVSIMPTLRHASSSRGLI